jgi:2-polyprenyl-6-hydroxyphenyl methylase/3-demethylubiquinone-9 3-methyltransferase
VQHSERVRTTEQGENGMVAGAAREAEDDRFAFGENWRDFSRDLGDERIASARAGIERLLGDGDLSGETFLDIGCGSGLMSLAAHQMGAVVTAFDFDADSVATSLAVRDKHAGVDAYRVLQGSALDPAFVTSLGTFDIVYSWGVLHHTGDMWKAFDIVQHAVAPGGRLVLAIYNDQGMPSRVWRRVKKAYVEGGPIRQRALLTAYGSWFAGKDLLVDAMALRHGVARLRDEREARAEVRSRGMDRRHDLIDWVGGYPFEVAKPEQVFHYFHDRGFELTELTTCRGDLGCNEYVFHRAAR